MQYEASGRVLSLARPATFRLIKEEVPKWGSVKPSALKAVGVFNFFFNLDSHVQSNVCENVVLCSASKRILELSVARVKRSSDEVDLREDPFLISPTALKYVATPRILELAKPTERWYSGVVMTFKLHKKNLKWM